MHRSLVPFLSSIGRQDGDCRADRELPARVAPGRVAGTRDLDPVIRTDGGAVGEFQVVGA